MTLRVLRSKHKRETASGFTNVVQHVMVRRSKAKPEKKKKSWLSRAIKAYDETIGVSNNPNKSRKPKPTPSKAPRSMFGNWTSSIKAPAAKELDHINLTPISSKGAIVNRRRFLSKGKMKVIN